MRSGFKRSELFGVQLPAFINAHVGKRNSYKKYERGTYVIVDTERGEQFGKVDTDEILLKKEQIKGELKNILRIS